MSELAKDQQTRTPPHGDALRPDPVAVDRQRRELAGAISRRTTVSPFPIYRALCEHSAEAVEAAIAAAQSAGVDPSSFPVYLTFEVDAAVRILDDPDWRTPDADTLRERIEGLADAALVGRVPQPRRLPPHIERAARATYAAGWGDRSAQDPLDDDRGVDVFRESLRRDADWARARLT